MRKVFWCCAVAGVTLAGGLFWAVQHGMRHPDSLVGQSLIGLSKSAVLLSPTTGLAPVIAEKVWHTSTSLGSEDCQEIPATEEPTPADPVADPEPMPVQMTPPASEEPVLKVSGVIQSEDKAAPIVIPEEEIKKAVEATLDFANSASAAEAIEVPALPAICPNMPYCIDEGPEVLPKPVEDEVREALTIMPKPEDGTEGVDVRTEEEDINTYLESTKTDGTKSGEETKEEAKPEPQSCPDSGCHSHYPYVPVCPHTGRSYPDMQCPNPAGHQPKQYEQPGSEEPSEPKATKKKKRFLKFPEGEDCPTHPEVDTMEYRSSDRNLNDYGPGAL